MKKNLKKVISTIAAIAIASSAFTAFAADFSDVADTASYKNAVENLVALNIVNGYEDGTFKPENEITRGEMSKMLVAAMGPAQVAAAEASKGSSNFTDTADHWAAGFIAQGVALGYINGMGDGTFAPDANVTYAQTVKMLVAALGYTQEAEALGGYPNGYMSVGSSIGVTDGITGVAGETNVNRGQVATLINNALDTPITTIIGYDQQLTVDANGNLVTQLVPETEAQDGKKGREYQTLLTTYFDAYVVRGRITDITKADKTADFRIEYADNFEDEKVEAYMGKNEDDEEELKGYVTEEVIYADDLDVDSLLYTYADAIIMENEDGDYELVSIAPYAKNDIVTLSADNYNADDTDLTEDVIAFDREGSSNKTDEYDLASNCTVYINGVEKGAVDPATIEKYIENKPTTVVKLVDTPEAGSKSVDGDYDAIMLSVYDWAIVSEVMAEEDLVTIYIEDSSIDGTTSEIEIDLDAVAEGELSYTVVDMEGNEVALDAIPEDAVLTLYYDILNEEVDGNLTSIDMIVCTDVVEGKVSSSKDDNGVKVYTIGDGEYKFAPEIGGSLKTGDEYSLLMNSFGFIVKEAALASAANYGIVTKVWTNGNDEQMMRIVNAEGKVVSYEMKKEADYNIWKPAYDAVADMDFTDVAVEDDEDTTDKNETVYVYEQMVVTYKLDSSDRIYDVKALAAVGDLASNRAEFSQSNAKVGSAKMSEATSIIDMTKALSAWSGNVSGKVAATTMANFVDEEVYTVLYGHAGNKFSDNTYPLVIVVEGVPGVSVNTSFAVVESTGSGTADDGMTYDTINFYGAGSTDTQVAYCDDIDALAEAAKGENAKLNKGDVFVYSLTSDGLIDPSTFAVIFEASKADSFANAMALQEDDDATVKNVTDWKNATVAALVDTWADANTNGKNVDLGFGVITDKSSNTVTVGQVAKDGANYYTDTFAELDILDSANVYVYDPNEKTNKVEVGSKASLSATKIAGQFTNDGEKYEWTKAGLNGEEDGKTAAAKFVFYKMVEDEIVDIIVVLPLK